MYQLEIRKRAINQAKTAYEWYASIQPELGEKFINNLQACYHKLSTSPMFYSYIAAPFRKIKLHHFDYILVFEVIENKVVVFALFHTKQKH